MGEKNSSRIRLKRQSSPLGLKQGHCSCTHPCDGNRLDELQRKHSRVNRDHLCGVELRFRAAGFWVGCCPNDCADDGTHSNPKHQNA
jgi:hypothetical protein